MTPGTAPSPAGGVEPVAAVAPESGNLDPWSVETMKTMQSVILAEIEKVIDAAGLSAVQKADYSNTGTVYAMDGLKSRLAVNYSFQSGYCSIIATPAERTSMPDNPPQYRVCADGREVAWHHLDYSDGRRLEGFIETLKSLL